MLTKQERTAIAERAKECIEVDGSLYEVLFGYPSYRNRPYEEGFKEILTRIIDLCDTSNMLELPVDKDGEYIRVGDVVYGEDNLRHEVSQIVFEDDIKWLVLVSDGGLCVGTYSNPTEFTHKQPVTIKSLAQRIKHVLGDEATSIGVIPYVELRRIAKQLESLGDNDE